MLKLGNLNKFSIVEIHSYSVENHWNFSRAFAYFACLKHFPNIALFFPFCLTNQLGTGHYVT